jgi:trimeric autotransporter adhesin
MRPRTHTTLPGHAPAGHRRPATRIIFSRPRLLLGAVGVIVGVILFSAGAAFAYFLFTTSSNDAQAVADTLPAPAGAALGGTATSASVPVTWTAPAGSPSYTPTGYLVLRCQGSGCTNFAAITSGGCANVTTTSCTDTDTALAPSSTYSYEVEAELDNWVSAPSAAFTASTTGPAQLGFTTQPSPNQSIQAQGTGSFPVTVAIQDGNGTTVSNDNSDQVTLGLTGGTSGATLTCTGGETATVSSGVASFTGCAVDKAGTAYQLTATSGSLIQVTSNPFNITAGTAAQLAFTTQPPSTSQSGAQFPVAVTVQDSDGNPIPSDNTDQVILGLTGGTSGATLSCGGSLTATASGGVASFTGCAVNHAGTGYQLTATSGSLTAATSNSFNITGSQLGFTTQPSPNQSIQAKGTGSFSVTVAVQDTTGATDTSDNSDQVTLGLTGGTSGATLTCGGSLTAQVTSGQVTFSGCAVDKTGTGYQLTATSSSLIPATSNPFDITAGTASQLVATSGSGQSATVSSDFASPLVATVEDADGNPVLTAGTNVKFQAPTGSGNPSVTFSGCSGKSCTVATNGSGQAAVQIQANGKAGSSYTITASATGLTPASFSETNTAAVSVSSLTSANGPSGTKGELDQDDSVSIGFSGPIDASTVCSDWTNGPPMTAAGTVTITGGGSGNPDVLGFTPASGACSTFNFGTISLGSGKYYVPGSSGGLSFTGSTIAYDSSTDTLTITLGTASLTGGTENPVSSSNLKLTLSSSILDANDSALASYTASSGGGQQF